MDEDQTGHDQPELSTAAQGERGRAAPEDTQLDGQPQPPGDDDRSAARAAGIPRHVEGVPQMTAAAKGTAITATHWAGPEVSRHATVARPPSAANSSPNRRARFQPATAGAVTTGSRRGPRRGA